MTNDYTVNLWYTKGKGTTFYLTIEYLIYGRGISNQNIWQKSGKGTIFFINKDRTNNHTLYL